MSVSAGSSRPNAGAAASAEAAPPRRSLLRRNWRFIAASALAILVLPPVGMYFWSAYLSIPTPKLIIVLGDCTATNLAPWLQRELAGKCDVWEPGFWLDSRILSARIDEWARTKQPDVVIFSVGLTDAFHSKGITNVPIGEYETNLRHIVATLRDKTRARLIWMTTVPAVREAKNIELDAYNAVAAGIMKEARVEIYDRNAALKAAGLNKLVAEDKIHPNSDAYYLMAKDLLKILARRG